MPQEGENFGQCDRRMRSHHLIGWPTPHPMRWCHLEIWGRKREKIKSWDAPSHWVRVDHLMRCWLPIQRSHHIRRCDCSTEVFFIKRHLNNGFLIHVNLMCNYCKLKFNNLIVVKVKLRWLWYRRLLLLFLMSIQKEG